MTDPVPRVVTASFSGSVDSERESPRGRLRSSRSCLLSSISRHAPELVGHPLPDFAVLVVFLVVDLPYVSERGIHVGLRTGMGFVRRGWSVRCQSSGC